MLLNCFLLSSLLKDADKGCTELFMSTNEIMGAYIDQMQRMHLKVHLSVVQRSQLKDHTVKERGGPGGVGVGGTISRGKTCKLKLGPCKKKFEL